MTSLMFRLGILKYAGFLLFILKEQNKHTFNRSLNKFTFPYNTV